MLGSLSSEKDRDKRAGGRCLLLMRGEMWREVEEKAEEEGKRKVAEPETLRVVPGKDRVAVARRGSIISVVVKR